MLRRKCLEDFEWSQKEWKKDNLEGPEGRNMKGNDVSNYDNERWLAKSCLIRPCESFERKLGR